MSYFVIHPGTPKSTSHLGPPIFSRPSTKSPDKTPCTNSLSIVRGGFCPGVFVWKILSGVVFVRSLSVRIHLLQQKVKHHFKFHVHMYDKKIISVTSHALAPPPVTNCHFLGPLPLERDVL